jgi:hypothetical protein
VRSRAALQSARGKAPHTVPRSLPARIIPLFHDNCARDGLLVLARTLHHEAKEFPSNSMRNLLAVGLPAHTIQLADGSSVQFKVDRNAQGDAHPLTGSVAQ